MLRAVSPWVWAGEVGMRLIGSLLVIASVVAAFVVLLLALCQLVWRRIPEWSPMFAGASGDLWTGAVVAAVVALLGRVIDVRSADPSCAAS